MTMEKWVKTHTLVEELGNMLKVGGDFALQHLMAIRGYFNYITCTYIWITRT